MQRIVGTIPDRLSQEYQEAFSDLKREDFEEAFDSLAYTNLKYFIYHAFESTEI